MELARQEPRSNSSGPDRSARIHRDFPCRETAAVASKPKCTTRAGLEPVLGIIRQGTSEPIIGVALRLGHQIACFFLILRVLKRDLVDRARKDARDPAVFDESNRVMFLTAVPAKEGRV
jgi:hypothetical protein